MMEWIDDFLLYAKSEKDLLDDIEAFLDVCSEVGFKLQPEKSHFFMKEAKYCGRIISADGVTYDPRHFDSLLAMNRPTMADELVQFVCAANWMRNAIPEFAKTIAPLQALMESAYSKAGKRTKQSVRKISIADSWGEEHTRAFDTIKAQLAAAVKLAHPRSECTMCLFTDASCLLYTSPSPRDS